MGLQGAKLFDFFTTGGGAGICADTQTAGAPASRPRTRTLLATSVYLQSTGEVDIYVLGTPRMQIATTGVTIPAPTGGTALSVTGSLGSAFTSIMTASSTVAGQSLGLLVRAGVGASDDAFLVQSQSGGTTFFTVFGDGGVTVGSPTGGDQGIGTINALGYYLNGVLLATPTTGTSSQSATGFATTGADGDAGVHHRREVGDIIYSCDIRYVELRRVRDQHPGRDHASYDEKCSGTALRVDQRRRNRKHRRCGRPGRLRRQHRIFYYWRLQLDNVQHQSQPSYVDNIRSNLRGES